MRKYRREIPDPKLHQQRLRARDDEIAALRLHMLDLQEKRDALGDSPADQATFDKLDAQIGNCETLRSALADLNAEEQALVDKIEEFQNFVDGRILWMPSAEPISPADFPAAARGVQRLLRPEIWRGAAAAAWNNFTRTPLPLLAGLALAIAIVIARPRIVGRVRRIGQAVRDGTADNMLATVRVLFWAIVLTAPLPGMVLLASMLLDSPDFFNTTLSHGLVVIATVLAIFQFLRQVCRPMGLGEAHFNWSARSLRTGRRALRVLMFTSGTMLFVISLMVALDNEQSRTSLIRLASTVHFLGMAIFAHMVLRPRGSIVAAASPSGVFHRLRHLWYALALAMPLVAIGVSWAGYGMTAGVFSLRLIYTFLLTVLTGIVLALVRRAASLGLRPAAVPAVAVVKIVSPGAPAPRQPRRQLPRRPLPAAQRVRTPRAFKSSIFCASPRWWRWC